MLWYNIELSCQKEKAIEIEELLLGYGASSISFTYQNNNEEFYELKPDETPLWELVKISAIFEKKISKSDIHKILEKSDYLNLIISTFKDRNWVKSYQKDLLPMQFGKRVWVIPSWAGWKPNTGDIIIKLDPGMAFGSGTHETTRLCLEYLEKNNLKDQHIVDYGCGSGILSIASAALGAKRVISVDIDPCALESTMENSRNNCVSDKISTFFPDKIPNSKVDLLIANIFSNVLIDLRDKFIKIVDSRSTVVLSGIMENQLTTIVESYGNFFKLKNITSKNNWCLVELMKK